MSNVEVGSSSCSRAAVRWPGKSDVARRCAVEASTSWGEWRSAIVGSMPSSTTPGATPQASSTSPLLTA